MAQDFAPLHRSIWTDEDFRALSMDAQHIYMMLLSHPDRNSAGVLSLTLRKWIRLAADLTPDRLGMALAELDAAGFIVMDESTEEVLVRSFIRRASVYKHIRMLANALRETSEVESPRIRSALAVELGRLPRLAIPDNIKMKAEAEAAQSRVDEIAVRPSPPDGPGQGSVHGMAHGMADGMAHPLAHPTVAVAGAVAGAGAVAPTTPETANRLEGGSHVSSGSADDPPRCIRHSNIPRYEEPPCKACERLRLGWQEQRSAESEFARPSWCGACDEWTRLVETDDGMARCQTCHPLAVAS